MGAAAARMALTSADLSVDAIDAIVGASTGPQQAIPCTAAFLQRELGAPEGRSACFDINATCLSFLFALQNVAHLVAAGVYERVLIVSSEIASRSLNPAERESAVLLGDAAAAVIVTRSEEDGPSGYWHGQFATYSGGADLTQLVGGGTLHHPNDPATTPEMNLFHMQGAAVFKQASQLLGPFLENFFTRLCWERQEVEAVIPHQASRHGIELLTSRLGFLERQVVWNLAERGNCIAASIPLTLAESVASERIKRGDRVILIGSGAGLTLGAIALTY
jgi:3-oxoacyl-[acyl-carrier-protein] synthase-3